MIYPSEHTGAFHLMSGKTCAADTKIFQVSVLIKVPRIRLSEYLHIIPFPDIGKQRFGDLDLVEGDFCVDSIIYRRYNKCIYFGYSRDFSERLDVFIQTI